MFHSLKTHQSVEAVEAGTGRLIFVAERGTARDFHVGDGVEVQSSEGCWFIGGIVESTVLGFTVRLA